MLRGVSVADLRSSLWQQNQSYYDEFFERTRPVSCVQGMDMPWTEFSATELEVVCGRSGLWPPAVGSSGGKESRFGTLAVRLFAEVELVGVLQRIEFRFRAAKVEIALIVGI